MRISVIIPTLDESRYISRTVLLARGADDAEVIVVDGGSADDTVEQAASCGAMVVSSAKGRAVQMNAGAAEAAGEVFLFLHADTRLPEGYGEYINDVLSHPSCNASLRPPLKLRGGMGGVMKTGLRGGVGVGVQRVVAGAFGLRVDSPDPGLRVIEWLANFRSRVLRMPYGDQAIFVRAEVFRAIGGFPEMPIMEDFELVRRLKARGRIAIAPAKVVTSARRWERLGVLRTTLINQAVILGYYAGVSPTAMRRWYG